jgi:GntR family transcriptional regulator, transcriptional repressor for pyruvate dehydrogenase complex
MTESSSTSPVFGVFERDMLPERIANRIVSLISERQLRPGDKLPSERELASIMQVSRPSLREALRALAILNIVEIRQGSGTYVSSLKPELLVEHLDFVFALDDSTFAELLEARSVLEPSLAALAAVHATEAELAELCACMEKVAASANDPAGFLEADIELHQIITQAAHNQILRHFMASLTRLGVASRARTVALPGIRLQTVDDHQKIVDALVRRDSGAAARAMQKHMENVRQSLSESISNSET